MQKIIDYTIVYSGGNEEDMVEIVNKHIEDGWQPIGGVFHKPAGFGITSGFFQAMVKYDDEKKDK